MSELERISDQLQRAYAGPAWHGPSVTEVLEGVTAEIASRRRLEDAHTIWELVNHIAAWMDVPRRRILGETVEVTMDINFPPVTDTSEAAWRKSLDKLADNQKKLVDLVLNLDEKRLDDPAHNGPTIYAVLHGVVQHHTYHAGQIALLKKGGT
jgi:uncharacterized damage-inducible protein DinB